MFVHNWYDLPIYTALGGLDLKPLGIESTPELQMIIKVAFLISMNFPH